MACLTIPFLTPEQRANPNRLAATYRIPLLNQVAVLGSNPAAARRRTVFGANNFLVRTHQQLLAVARSDLAVSWSNDYNSLLELAEACDVPVRWSCRTGVCHNCETTLIAGDLDYDPEPVEPPATGNALICCSQPRNDVVLDL